MNDHLQFEVHLPHPDATVFEQHRRRVRVIQFLLECPLGTNARRQLEDELLAIEAELQREVRPAVVLEPEPERVAAVG